MLCIVVIVKMNEEKRKRIGLFLGRIVVFLSAIALGLGCYILCSTGFYLYRAGCTGRLAAMLIGIIYTVAILALICVISSTWKELRKNNYVRR